MFSLPEVQEGLNLFELIGIDFNQLFKSGIAYGLRLGFLVILLAVGINYSLRLFKQ